MRKTQSTALILTSFLFFVFAAFGAVSAQVETNEASTAKAEEVTAADLGVENPGLLPTNPFYFFKEWGRGTRMFFTFNKVAKVEYELKVANQKAAELKKVQDAKPNDVKAINKALDNYNKNATKLKTRLQSLEEKSNNPNVDKLLDRVTERAVQHQQLFEELKTKHEEIREQVVGVQKEVDTALREVSGRLDTPQEFKERLDTAIQGQKDGQLKELKAIQIINRIEESAVSPEVATKLTELKEKQIQGIEAKLKSGSINLSKDSAFVEKLTSDQVERPRFVTELREKTVDTNLRRELDTIQRDIPVRDMSVPMKSDTSVPMKDIGSPMMNGDANIPTRVTDTQTKDIGVPVGKVLCVEIYAPVCGTDGKTYGNECKAKANGAGVKYKGACVAGREETGVCADFYEPVCGADNKTYSNSCFAGLAKTQVKHKGECVVGQGSGGGGVKFEAVPQSTTTKISPDPIKNEALPTKTPPVTPPVNVLPSTDIVKVETKGGVAVTVSRLWNVEVTDNGFSPTELEIKKGDTVVWTNKGNKPSWPASASHPTHNVYPEKGGCIDSAFDACRELKLGEVFKFVFNQVGSWKYHDHLNSTRFGAVIVE